MTDNNDNWITYQKDVLNHIKLLKNKENLLRVREKIFSLNVSNQNKAKLSRTDNLWRELNMNNSNKIEALAKNLTKIGANIERRENKIKMLQREKQMMALQNSNKFVQSFSKGTHRVNALANSNKFKRNNKCFNGEDNQFFNALNNKQSPIASHPHSKMLSKIHQNLTVIDTMNKTQRKKFLVGAKAALEKMKPSKAVYLLSLAVLYMNIYTTW
jgi:hypothetical protein